VQRGVDLLQRAADKNHFWSANYLGVLYRDGDEVAQDYEKALSLFKAGAQGNSDAEENLNSLTALLAAREEQLAVQVEIEALRDEFSDEIALAEKAAQFWLYSGMQERCEAFDIESGAELFWAAYSKPHSAAYGSSEEVWNFAVCLIGVGAVSLQVGNFIDIDKAKAAGKLPYPQSTAEALERDCDGVYNLPESEKMDATPEQVVGLLRSCVPTMVSAIKPLLPFKYPDTKIAGILAEKRAKAIDAAVASRATRSSGGARDSFMAVISCFVGQNKTHVASCFTDTHLKITRNNRARIYEPWDFQSAGSMRNSSLYVELPANFELKAQNGTRGVILGVQILDEYENVVFEDQAAQYQVVYVGN
jgi:hypothetical protein